MKTQSMLRKLALCLTLVAAVAVTTGAAAQTKKQVKISHATAADVANDNHMVSFIIASYINANSDTLEARIYPANQLGEERAVVEGMQLGAGATIHIGGTAIHNNFNKRMGVLDLPFMWHSYEHAHHVLDGKVGETLAAEHEKLGLKVLGWQDSWGYRNVVTTKKEVKKPEDLKGLKIRTIQTPTYVAALNAMGASATPMAFGEVYTSLQTGVVDGAENNWPSYDTARHFEVAPFYSLTEHSMAPEMLLMSKKVYDALTPAEQQMFRDAAKASVPYMRKLWDEKELASRKVVEAGGAKVTEVDKQAFQDAMKPVYDKFITDPKLKDMVSKIQATN